MIPGLDEHADNVDVLILDILQAHEPKGGPFTKRATELGFVFDGAHRHKWKPVGGGVLSSTRVVARFRCRADACDVRAWQVRRNSNGEVLQSGYGNYYDGRRS